MKVEVGNGKINIEASYIEIATILQVMNSYLLKNNDKFVKDLAYELQYPDVAIEK